jgi:hypothetical protein
VFAREAYCFQREQVCGIFGKVAVKLVAERVGEAPPCLSPKLFMVKGLEVSEAKRLKALEEENSRPQAVDGRPSGEDSDSQRGQRKRVVSPCARRRAVKIARQGPVVRSLQRVDRASEFAHQGEIDAGASRPAGGAVHDARIGQRLLDHLAGVPAGPVQHQHRAVGAAGGPLDVPSRPPCAGSPQPIRSRFSRPGRGGRGGWCTGRRARAWPEMIGTGAGLPWTRSFGMV